ncbi:hypothetical protein [Streptomyces cylindrosporus]|uniref:Serine/threonine protein kinase n=1 Tax=Streptomyces cylindrosporus TaxID=2927583 RepID=A0ABS9XZN2_9ACTN|nr:hypothetical protein [Streptomyces cylindrosporus]MCI3269665.1 hypothetical protein [Streptomyces cylindrosporus]
MTSIDTGSAGDTANDGSQSEGDKSESRTRILIAAIGGLALVAAATVTALLTFLGGNNGSPPPTTASASPPSVATEDPCDLRRLADSWNQPPSQRYNETLFAGRRAPNVYTQVGGPEDNPEISVKGQVSLDIPAGQVLYLITRPDPDSKDEYGHPGSNRFYPASPVTPTSSGCWEDDNHSVGYPGAKGISETYMLVLVGSDQAAKFPADRKSRDWDGYSQEQWQAITKIDVMSFHVSTA